MRSVGVWAGGLLASAIPFVFVGAVIRLGAYVFEAVGQHALPVRSETSFQSDAAPEQVLAVASADASDDLAQHQLGKHTRHHQAGPTRQARSHSGVRHSSLVNGGIARALTYW